jgi:hypothetical protein
MTRLRRKMIEDDPAPALHRSLHLPRGDPHQLPRIDQRRGSHLRLEGLPPPRPALGGVIGRPIVTASRFSQ